MLRNYPTAETGGFTPHQLKYGTLDADHFRLPNSISLEVGVKPHQLIKPLDENLKHIRDLSHKFQMELAEERRKSDANISSYSPGDLVLFNPREKPTDHLPSKLSPNWLGPYQVVSQSKNDVTVKHIVLHTESVFHVGRLKPFFGSLADAIEIAQHDQHQVLIKSINYFTGNPHVRSSMTFNVTFVDGTIDMPYGEDLRNSQQFDQYVQSLPILFPLRFTASAAKTEIRKLNKLAILNVQPNSRSYVDLRIYDGTSSTWFDSLSLPDPTRPYLTPIVFTRWINRTQREIEAIVPFFPPTHPKHKIVLNYYDTMAYVHLEWEYWSDHNLEFDSQRKAFPQIMRR
jgi:hypothetical protein